jgi:hypothetical protein
MGQGTGGGQKRAVPERPRALSRARGNFKYFWLDLDGTGGEGCFEVDCADVIEGRLAAGWAIVFQRPI